jgi:filamentous hemagglutinin
VANGDKSKGEGNLTATGANLSAGQQATLDASGDLNLLASSNTATSKSTNSGSNASMGATFALGGSQNGLSFQAGAQGSKGRANGDEVTYNNTTVTVGTAQTPGTLNLKSGGNTTLKGATANADTINADIKGNLAIESLQDKAIYDSKQTSVGAGVSVCIPPICYGTMVAVNVNAAQTKIKADHDSVGLQSGLNAGDGGFNVKVGGKTELVGGQVTSTEKAVTDNKNSFTSAGPVTTTDLQNKSALDASSVSVNVSVSGGGASTGSTGGMAGYGQVNDSQTSTTRAGISGLAGNASARTGDAQTGLKPVFTQQDADKINKSLSVQTAVTADFGKNSAKFVGDVAGSKQKELTEAAAAADKAGNKAEADRLTVEASLWSEGGAYRVSMHLIAGAMGGGANGAAGAATSAIAAPALDQIQTQLTDSLIAGGMNADVAKATASVLTLGAATTLAGAAGGVQGATTGLNVDLNNRQLHPKEIKWIADKSKDFADKLSKELGRPVTELEAMQWLTSAGESNVDVGMQRSNGQFVRGTSNTEEAQAYDAAKAYIASSTKANNPQNNFTDERGQNQTLFSAKNGDFNKPEVYSQYRNDANYRDYYWTVMGVNLRGDKLSPQEQAVYDQRQKVADEQALKQAAVLGVQGIAGRVAINAAARAGEPASAGAVKLTPEEAAAAVKARIEKNQHTDLPNVYASHNVGKPLGKPTGQYDLTTNMGPLNKDLASSFSGGKYTEIVLLEDVVLYRAGTQKQPLGQFFSTEAPTGVIPTRVDSAVLPAWPGGGKSPIDSVFEVRIPAGTKVYAGQVGYQSGFYTGGAQQIVIPTPWNIPGVKSTLIGPLK